MTTFRPDTSFPFLALARRLGIEYGHVIRMAECLQNPEAPGAWMISRHLWQQTKEAVYTEERRRALATAPAQDTKAIEGMSIRICEALREIGVKASELDLWNFEEALARRGLNIAERISPAKGDQSS